MTIQWYPGHMHKAQGEIKKNLHKMDLIIEVVDARIPYSSSNPVISELRNFRGKITPLIRLMNKSDLADNKLTEEWIKYFDSQQATKAVNINAHEAKDIKKIIPLVKKLLVNKVEKEQSINAMIMGIPNVGKSTIVNALAGRKVAKVGNQPAVTQHQQRIDLDGLVLWDTPGILWPKIDNENSSYRLAISGAIKDTALTYDDIAFYLVDYLQKYYPDCLSKNYQLSESSSETLAIIEAIGHKRGCLKSGGRVDLDKVCKIIINEYRSCKLGKISLEIPDMMLQEIQEVEEKIRLKEENKLTRKTQFKKNR